MLSFIYEFDAFPSVVRLALGTTHQEACLKYNYKRHFSIFRASGTGSDLFMCMSQSHQIFEVLGDTAKAVQLFKLQQSSAHSYFKNSPTSGIEVYNLMFVVLPSFADPDMPNTLHSFADLPKFINDF